MLDSGFSLNREAEAYVTQPWGKEATASFLEALCNREICILSSVGQRRNHHTLFSHYNCATVREHQENEQ